MKVLINNVHCSNNMKVLLPINKPHTANTQDAINPLNSERLNKVQPRLHLFPHTMKS